MREEQAARKVEDLPQPIVELKPEEAEAIQGGCSNNLVVDPYSSQQSRPGASRLLPYIEQDN